MTAVDPTDGAGWLAPDGTMHPCLPYLHYREASRLAAPLGWRTLSACLVDASPEPYVEADNWLLSRGWIRCYGHSSEHVMWASDGRRPTIPQRRALADLGYDPDDATPWRER